MKKYYLLIIISFIFSTCIFGQKYERYKILVDTVVTSTNLGYDKRITLTVPLEWQKSIDKNFPLIIIFDRQNKRSHHFIMNTIDYLTSNEQMPSAIIVSVESEQQYRGFETNYKVSAPNGKAEKNERFIFDELIPLLRQDYKASLFTMLIGHSRYGYFTTSLFHTWLDGLNAVISLSPFFIQNNVNLTDSLVESLSKVKLNSFRYYRFGIGNDYPKDFEAMSTALNSIENKKIDAKGTLFPNAVHNVTPGLTIASALYEIFEFWSHKQGEFLDNSNKQISKQAELSQDIKNHYGEDLPFSLGTLNGKGWYFFNEKEYEKAIQAWELLLKHYPNFSEAYLNISEAEKEMKTESKNSIQKFIKNLSESEFYSAAEKKELLNEIK